MKTDSRKRGNRFAFLEMAHYLQKQAFYTLVYEVPG